MFRDRTNLFLSFRQSYTHHPYAYNQVPSGAEPLMNNDFEAIEMESMPPAWLDISSKVDQALGTIRTEMATLAALHKKNALPGFDDRTAQEREIDNLTFKITSSLHKCQGIAKQFEGMSANESDPAVKKMAQNIRVSMAQKIQEVSSMFRKMQSSYLRKLRKDVDMPTFRSQGPVGGVESDVHLSEQTLQQTQSLLNTETDAALQQREQEINRIAQGILEVADIFKDLQNMVIDQGTILDRIDYNVESMSMNVKGADKELIKGSQYQKRTQKCKIIFLLSLIVFGLLLVLILKPRRH